MRCAAGSRAQHNDPQPRPSPSPIHDESTGLDPVCSTQLILFHAYLKRELLHDELQDQSSRYLRVHPGEIQEHAFGVFPGVDEQTPGGGTCVSWVAKRDESMCGWNGAVAAGHALVEPYACTAWWETEAGVDLQLLPR
jgi:hypothetical protein